MECLPRRQLAGRRVAGTADDRVIGDDNRVEEHAVRVVEASARRGRKPFRHPRASEEGGVELVLCREATFDLHVARDHDACAGLDLVEQLPLQHRHASDRLEAQHGMVVRAGHLEPLTRSQLEDRVVARVEEFGRPHRVGFTIEHLEVDVDLGVGMSRRELADPTRRTVGHANSRLIYQAVAHRRRPVVGVGRPEVAVAVDQRVAEREVLGHARQRVVDRAVAVRVELAHDVADRGRALRVVPLRPQAAGVHAVEDPPVHGLQAVARVGQRARGDDRHRVVQEGAFHLLLDLDRFDVRFERGLGAVGHAATSSESCDGEIRCRGSARLSRSPG